MEYKCTITPQVQHHLYIDLQLDSGAAVVLANQNLQTLYLEVDDRETSVLVDFVVSMNIQRLHCELSVGGFTLH